MVCRHILEKTFFFWNECLCFGTSALSFGIICKKFKITQFCFVERKNSITLILFGNGVLPFRLVVLIGENSGEIKMSFELWRFILDNSSKSLVVFLKFDRQKHILSFYFQFIPVRFPFHNENQFEIFNRFGWWKAENPHVSFAAKRQPSGYLRGPLQNCLSLINSQDREVFIKIDCCFCLFCWL